MFCSSPPAEVVASSVGGGITTAGSAAWASRPTKATSAIPSNAPATNVLANLMRAICISSGSAPEWAALRHPTLRSIAGTGANHNCRHGAAWRAHDLVFEHGPLGEYRYSTV